MTCCGTMRRWSAPSPCRDRNFRGDSMPRRDTVNPLYAGGTVGTLMLTAIERFPTRPAIADDEIHYTYREFGEAIGRMVRVFHDLGLRKGDALAILSGNRVAEITCRFAAILIGIRFTPLHPAASEENHRFILDDAEIDALLVDPTNYAAVSYTHLTLPT